MQLLGKLLNVPAEKRAGHGGLRRFNLVVEQIQCALGILPVVSLEQIGHYCVYLQLDILIILKRYCLHDLRE